MNAPNMTLAHVLQAFAIASMFVLWPLGGKYAGIPSAWLSVLVCVVSAMVCITLTGAELISAPVPALKVLGLVTLCCAFNGLGTYFYANRVIDPNIPTANFIVTVIVAMVIMTMVFNTVLTFTLPSLRQLFGVVLACIAIFTLAK
jgi:hypothetical protein